jgi:hypothetical protein
MLHRSRWQALAVAALVVAGGGQAAAQGPLVWPLDEPGPFVREAFAAPYGQALVAELGEALRAGADPACLQAKKLAAEDLRARGGELLVNWGTRTMKIVLGFIDENKFAEHLAASAGPDAAKELERLRTDAEVARYLAVEKALRLAKVADYVVEQLDRYALLTRIKLRSVSPLSTGNDRLLDANPAERVEQELEEIEAKSTSPELRRFRDLGDKAAEALQAALKTREALTVGPGTYFRGVEADLAELCIGAAAKLDKR